MKRRLILCTTLGVLVLLIAFSWLSSNPNNDAQETQALQIFLDEDLTRPYVDELFWGTLHGRTINVSIWIKNNMPYPLQHLSLIAPSLPTNYTLTWNCENHTLNPNETKQATLTLTVPLCDVENIKRLGGRFYIVYYVDYVDTHGDVYNQ